MTGTIRPLSRIRLLLLTLALAAAATPRPAHTAELGGEFIVFPTVSKELEFTDRITDDLDSQVQHPEIDFFATADYGQLRFLAEYEVSGGHHDDSHFTRLQLGWSPNPDVALWAGRFHSPLGYWNTQHHHGKYLETSASRPGFLTYEHSGGVLPLHVVGLYLEGWNATGRGTLHYTAAAGKSAVVSSGMLKAQEVLGNSIDSHKNGAVLRLDWQPEDPDHPLLGAFAAHMTIPINPPSASEAELTISGLFGDWNYRATRVFGALFNVNDSVTGAADNTFNYGYLQAEYFMPVNWTLYGRVEGGSGIGDDPYLALFPTVFDGNRVVGARFDFMDNQAFKVEYARVQHVDRHFDQVTFQWSASYP